MSKTIDITAFDTNLGISYSKYASDKLGKDYWIVKKAFRYNLDGIGVQQVIVPKSYLTDGASVPRPFWGFFPPWGRYGQAAVLHDWLCEYLGFWENSKDWNKISRKRCDQIFNEAMGDLGVNKFTRLAMYNAVNIYSHLSSTIYQTYDATKHEVELFLLEHYNKTGEWL